MKVYKIYGPSDDTMDSTLQLVTRLTKDIVETYRICNPQFQYSEELNPKRFLTTPSAGVLNDGHDNANSDLILFCNLELANLDTQRRSVILAYLLIFIVYPCLCHTINLVCYQRIQIDCGNDYEN